MVIKDEKLIERLRESIRNLLPLAWGTEPAPKFPDNYGVVHPGEDAETRDAFHGHRWFEVDVDEIPVWFSALNFMPSHKHKVYYTATYIHHALSMDPAGERTGDFLEGFMRRLMTDAVRYETQYTETQLLTMLLTLKLLYLDQYDYFYSSENLIVLCHDLSRHIGRVPLY